MNCNILVFGFILVLLLVVERRLNCGSEQIWRETELADDLNHPRECC
jgi:hypothetical protein